MKAVMKLARLALPSLVAILLLATAAIAQNTDLQPGSAGLVQPAELVKSLQADSAKPTVFYVGPRVLFAQAHIPGAVFIGPAYDRQSLNNLNKRIAALPKDSSIVLYCGCCPWAHCPNIRPAYKELQKQGFTKVKALYLASNFGTDWVEKGYPVEKDSGAR
jgi:thiosulfate/3-mercaptopyruvate sulfurtransferase